jgi:hypothetical protein
MGIDASRRCALWVSPRVLAAAQELADLIGLDVDSFVTLMVLELYDQESAEGRLRSRAARTEKPSIGHVIPMRVDRTKRRRPSQARLE